MSPSSQKLNALTTTRFIAALSVVFYHGGDGLYLLSLFPIRPLLTSGFTAVNYFYVLSGFVMALAYYRPGQKFEFRSYWTARFSRIYPLYIFSFIITCLYYLEIMGKVNSDKIWANVLLYQAWIPRYALSFNFASWSLAVEAFFYILFPFLVIFAMRQPPKRLIWMSIGFWVVSQLAHSAIGIWLGLDARLFLTYFPPFHLNSFLLGVAGGVWYLSEAPRHPHKTSTNLAWMAFSLVTVAAALIIQRFSLLPVRTFSFNVGLLAPLFLIFVLTLALDGTRISKVLSHPALVLLGDASYALYILHIPVRWIMERYLASMGATMTYGQFFGFLYMPFLLTVSVLTFLYLERPARDWLRHNMHKLPLMLLDLLLVAGALWVSFTLLLGREAIDLPRTQTYALRIGLAIFFTSLLIFRYYITASWKSLTFAILLGAVLWTGFMYLAWRGGWIEVFPRVVMASTTAIVFAAIFGSRILIRRLAPASLV
jgi:peptidoglycan/LPS O-acetylase OafA/YrhL